MKLASSLSFALLLVSLAATASADVIHSGQPSTIPVAPGGNSANPVTPSTVTPGQSTMPTSPGGNPNNPTTPGTITPGQSTVPANPGGSAGSAPAYTPPNGQTGGTNGTEAPAIP
jgi:hypothetical protein